MEIYLFFGILGLVFLIFGVVICLVDTDTITCATLLIMGIMLIIVSLLFWKQEEKMNEIVSNGQKEILNIIANEKETELSAVNTEIEYETLTDQKYELVYHIDDGRYFHKVPLSDNYIVSVKDSEGKIDTLILDEDIVTIEYVNIPVDQTALMTATIKMQILTEKQQNMKNKPKTEFVSVVFTLPDYLLEKLIKRYEKDQF